MCSRKSTVPSLIAPRINAAENTHQAATALIEQLRKTALKDA